MSLGMSPFLQRIFSEKASVRPNRFFGEAYVASKLPHEDGWYSSYKWLTSKTWTNEIIPRNEFHREFKGALKKHFPLLHELQTRASVFGGQLGCKPVPPDLWLIRNGEHWFLEVKIPPDHMDDSQIAGLVLIATCLPSATKIHVGVVYLQEENVAGNPIPPKLRQRFEDYCRRIKESRIQV